MASGRGRCMYCEDSQGTDIEHFWPKERYHSKAFSWENYLLACSHCNSNEKGTQFPTHKNKARQEIPSLINPTQDEPLEHLFFSTDGRFKDNPQSKLAKKSIQVFGLNRPALVEGRADAWDAVQTLLIDYDKKRKTNDAKGASHARRRLCKSSFSSALVFLLDYSKRGEVFRKHINPECLAVLDARPGIYRWKV
jgi:uncharacterized protein (TIGR02646 family)